MPQKKCREAQRGEKGNLPRGKCNGNLGQHFRPIFFPGFAQQFPCPKTGQENKHLFFPQRFAPNIKKFYVHQLCHTSSKFPAFLSHCPNFTSFFPQMVFLCVSAHGMIRKTMDIVTLFFQESTPKLPINFLFPCASDPEFGRLDSQRQCSYLAVEYFFANSWVN